MRIFAYWNKRLKSLMGNRVVITGMGIWSCLGTSLEEVCQSLYTGKSGIVLDPLRKEMGFRSGLTGQLPTPELKGELPRSQRVYMPQQAQYAYCATRDALRHARIDQEKRRRCRGNKKPT